MENTNDIDILLTLNPHGWSTCFLYRDGESYEIAISHIFNNPYAELIQVLTDLIEGKQFGTLFWYGEPGGHRLEFVVKRKEVLISVDHFHEEFDEQKLFQLMFLLTIELKQLVAIFYFQLQKTYVLLQDKNFAETREKDFPLEKFIEFEKLVKQFLEI